MWGGVTASVNDVRYEGLMLQEVEASLTTGGGGGGGVAGEGRG